MSSPFTSLSDAIALPRIEGLTLSPDGSRAVVTVATLSADATAYERALWEIAADGSGEPMRLTRSAKGEAGAAFASTGDLLFTSARPDAGAEDDDPAQLWLLPARGGEARCISRLAGGAGSLAAVAADAPVAVLGTELMPSATTLEEDARIRADRKKRKVSAILHTGYPVRYWDHDLGPGQPTLLSVNLGELERERAGASAGPAAPETAGEPAAQADSLDDTPPYPAHLPRPVDLAPQVRRAGGVEGAAISPDGRTVIAVAVVPQGVYPDSRLVAIDVATQQSTVIVDEPGVLLGEPTISPDGTQIAYARQVKATPDGARDSELWVADLDGANARQVAADWDRWAQSLAFSANGRALVVTADNDGRAPIFLIDLEDDEVVRLTRDDYAYSQVRVDRNGGGLVALRASVMSPLQPVRIDEDGVVTELATPAPSPEVTATLSDVDTTAEDGTRVRGWLLTPPDASESGPAPLLLWIHGGPLNSWNQWSWRWNPHIAVARGYAVLLPDPALSTGYGIEFINRGWNSWGAKPFTDLMELTDEVLERPELDDERTAAMGGSFGGYMANWIAGHTDRFDAVVTHAALWDLEQFGGTTDMSGYWQSIFSPEATDEFSPHHGLPDVSSPMLVIHGDKDYRVPVGESLRLWSDLNRAHHGSAEDFPHRLLYFPDENHWILKPQHAAIWYETVFAFLSAHVLGEEGELPESLG